MIIVAAVMVGGCYYIEIQLGAGDWLRSHPWVFIPFYISAVVLWFIISVIPIIWWQSRTATRTATAHH